MKVHKSRTKTASGVARGVGGGGKWGHALRGAGLEDASARFFAVFKNVF